MATILATIGRCASKGRLALAVDLQLSGLRSRSRDWRTAELPARRRPCDAIAWDAFLALRADLGMMFSPSRVEI